MTTLTLSDITAAPAGYSFHIDSDYYGVDKRHFWVVSQSTQGGIIIAGFPLDNSLYQPALLKRNSSGAIVFDQAGFDARVAHSIYPGETMRPIPDSELPEGGMTEFHTHFNAVSKKWELPNIDAEVHSHHERNHDSDVAAAVASICECRIDLLHRKAMLANLNPDQTSRANTAYTGLDECIDEIVAANAEPAVERAWLISLGDIKHTADHNPEAHYVNRAHDFATAYINLIDGKTTAQRRGYKYQYTLCLIDELNADRDRTGSARFLPKGVKLVKSKSSPADATEVTLASLFTKLRGRISPSEGAPKQPV